MSNYPLLIGPDGTVHPLAMFAVGNIKRKYGLDTMRAAFGVGFTEFGDRRPEPLTITLKGLIFGATPVEYQQEKDRLYRLLNRRGQYLRVNGRQVPIGGIVNDDQDFEDIMGKVDNWQWELNALSPFWEDVNPVEILLPNFSGDGLISTERIVEVSGTARAYPTFTFDAVGLSAFEFFVNGRTLSWSYFTGPTRSFYTGSVVLDYYKGEAYLVKDGVVTDIRPALRTDSQFASLNESTPSGPGQSLVRMKATGENPVTISNLKITFKERYY